jgi:UDP-N-acetylglucosamine 2-epimerase (non-hydrolysing)
VEAGTTTLAGLATDQALADVLEAAVRHTRPAEQERAASLPCPYGDGTAGVRIAEILADDAADALLAMNEPDFTDGRLPW